MLIIANMEYLIKINMKYYEHYYIREAYSLSLAILLNQGLPRIMYGIYVVNHRSYGNVTII